MSTNTDATHFSSCYGQLILQNCVFDGHGDDAVNVHNYEHAFALVGGNRYRLACLATDGTHTQAVDLPSVGDEMQLIAHGTLDKGEKFVVIAAQANADGTCDVTFDRSLPVGSEGKYYLENATACPEFVFSHCRTRNHFARSVLIKTRRATVEKNIFEHSDLTAVVVAAEENWGEGTSSEHVEICNNVFLACGTRGDRRQEFCGNVYRASGQKPLAGLYAQARLAVFADPFFRTAGQNIRLQDRKNGISGRSVAGEGKGSLASANI